MGLFLKGLSLQFAGFFSTAEVREVFWFTVKMTCISIGLQA